MPKIIATKQDWINLGYQFFAKKGIAGIVVENMAKKLGVNKSSFYWFFKTKAQFMQEVISFWIQQETEQIISLTNQTKTPSKKWDLFLKITFKNDPYLEFIFFLKKYALKHPDIQLIIDNIDKRRLKYAADLLQELNYSKKDAKIKASLFYKYLIGYHEMIRHKKQKTNYLTEVKKELRHFISF